MGLGSTVGRQIGAWTFSTLERVDKAGDLPTLHGILKRAGRHLGLDSFTLCGLRPGPNPVDASLFLAAVPDSWRERYFQGAYFADDPVVRQTLHAQRPFLWSETVGRDRLTERARLIMNEAAEAGLRDGVTVPVHGPHGVNGVISFAGTEKISAEARAACHIIGLYAFDRARFITTSAEREEEVVEEYEYGDVEPLEASLTNREIECLTWAANGKTSWEISEVLRISERTVESYMRTATVKLGAATRTHAVAIALRMGLLG